MFKDKKNLILFDVDHTLLSGKHGHHEAFNAALRWATGCQEIKIEELASMWGGTDRLILNEALTKLGSDITRIARCFEIMIETFESLLPQTEIRVHDGVIELLCTLREDNILGLVTGNIKRIAEMKLGQTQLWDYFDNVGGFGDMPHERRSELVEAAIIQAEKLGFRPTLRNVYVVGDTPRDIQAGREAKVRTIAVATGSKTNSLSALKSHGPDLAVKDFSQGKKAILSLINE